MTKPQTDRDKKALKNWFDRAAARALGKQVAGAFPRFDTRKFVELATRDLSKLTFMARVRQFADALGHTLPSATPRALAVLTQSLPPVLPDCDAVTDGWLQWPLGQYIADHGLPYFDESMTAMIALTQRFSAEFAVRPFVIQRPTETFARLRDLTDHHSPHVRRWCSEGTRSRLPWGSKVAHLVTDPGPIWPIVEALKDDPVRYVQRSVANNLNDIAKDHPSAVVKRCASWSKGAGAGRKWTIAHALRTLVKDGDPQALAIIGYGPPHKIAATLSIAPKRIELGGAITLTTEVCTTAARKQDLMVDYVVHYVRKGDKTSGKVFKWCKACLPAREKLTLTKRHSMRPTTTRALYPGKHRVELQINGVRVAEAQFRLAGD